MEIYIRYYHRHDINIILKVYPYPMEWYITPICVILYSRCNVCLTSPFSYRPSSNENRTMQWKLITCVFHWNIQYIVTHTVNSISLKLYSSPMEWFIFQIFVVYKQYLMSGWFPSFLLFALKWGLAGIYWNLINYIFIEICSYYHTDM